MRLLIIIIILLLLFGGLGGPRFGFGTYGYTQTGGIGLLIAVLIVLVILGVI